jgi:glucosyl-3-phosphoglycerate synthase
MPDFQQNVVPTFTRLVDEDLGQMEKDTVRAARRMPIGIIIPALFSDLSSPAMQHIIQELAGMNFVKRIYISLAQSSEAEFERAREIIQPLENRGVLLWNEAPAVQSVLEEINQAVPVGDRGKGSAVWTALGYALGKSEVSVLAFHDADILTYDRGFLLRLLYPGREFAISVRQGFLRPLFGPAARAGRPLILFSLRQSLARHGALDRAFGEYQNHPFGSPTIPD